MTTAINETISNGVELVFDANLNTAEVIAGISDAVKDFTQEEYLEALVGTADVVNSFADFIVLSKTYSQAFGVTGGVLAAADLKLQYDKIDIEVKTCGYVTNETQLAMLADVTAMAGVIATSSMAVISAPMLGIVAGLLAATSVALTVASVTQESGDTSIAEAAITETQKVINQVSESVDLLIEQITADFLLDNGTPVTGAEGLHYVLLKTADESLSESSIENIVEAASNGYKTGVEGFLQAIERVMGLGGAASVVDANDYFSRSYDVFIDLSGASITGVVSLAGMSADSIVSLAAEDNAQGTAVRYALLHLDPFAVVGSLPTYTAEASSLDINNFSKPHLKDRAYVLSQYINRNISNNDYAAGGQGHEIYRDLAAGISFSNAALPVDAKYYIFGDDSDNSGALVDGYISMGGNDTLHGGEGSDHIEGNLGDDTLHGDEDTDHLYGGSGSDYLSGGNDTDADIYYWDNGDGNDVIIDADLGNDRIHVNGVDLATLTFKELAAGSNTYLANGDDNDPYNDIVFMKSASEGYIGIAGQGDNAGSITLQAYSDGAFGINLQAPNSVGQSTPAGQDLMAELKMKDRYVSFLTF